MSTNMKIGALIGLAVLLVILLGSALFHTVRRKYQTHSEFKAPPGHFVYKQPLYETQRSLLKADVKSTTTGESERSYKMAVDFISMTQKVTGGNADLLYQRVVAFPGYNDAAKPEIDMYRLTRSPYGVMNHWVIVSSVNPMSMINGGNHQDPTQLLVDPDNPPLIFPERALKAGDQWNITGKTKFAHRKTLLDGTYDLRYHLIGTEKNADQTVQKIEGRFTIDCPKQAIKNGNMSLHETAIATMRFDVNAGAFISSTFTIDRTIAGEYAGKPQSTHTTMTGSIQQVDNNLGFNTSPLTNQPPSPLKEGK